MLIIKRSIMAIMICLVAFLSAKAVEADKALVSHPVIDQVFAKYEKAFNAGDARAIGSLWKSDGEFIDAIGERVVGRDNIEKLFLEFFSKNKGHKLSIKVLSLKEEDQGKTIVVEILPVVTPSLPGAVGKNKATLVLNKSGDQWLIEGVKENMHLPASYEHLKDLQWLIGSWAIKEPAKTDTEKAKPVSINSTCQWTANKSFITRTFTSQLQQLELHGTEIIGWDPQANTIRSWQFESTGGFTESVWKLDGTKLVIETKGVLASGEPVSSVTTINRIEDNTISLVSQKRTRGGKPQEDIGPITLVRVTTATPITPDP